MYEIILMIGVAGLVVFCVVAALRGMHLKVKAGRDGISVECD